MRVSEGQVRRWRWWLLGGLGLLLAAQAGWERLGAEEPQAESSSSRSTRETHSSKPGDAKTKKEDLATKLDQVVEHQQKILTKLDEVLKELQIVKIRATR